MKNYSLRLRKPRTPGANAAKSPSKDLDDAEINRLVKLTADYMKAQIQGHRSKDDTDTACSEDFLPVGEPTREGPLTVQKKKSKSSTTVTRNRIPQGLHSGFEEELDKNTEHYKTEDVTKHHNDIKTALEKSSQDKLLAKSVLKPDLEKQHAIPPYSKSRRSQIKERRKLRDSKAGNDWYDMRATEMTPELANDLKAIQMRAVLDPKRFYRKNDMKKPPKFVQIGKVMDSPLDFYHARVSRKDRRQTIVDELLADAETRRYNKRKYMELQIHRSKSKRRRRTLTSLL